MLVIRPLHSSQNHVFFGSSEVQTPGGLRFLALLAAPEFSIPCNPAAFSFPTEEFVEDVSGNFNGAAAAFRVRAVDVPPLLSNIDSRPTPLPCENTHEMMLNEMR